MPRQRLVFAWRAEDWDGRNRRCAECDVVIEGRLDVMSATCPTSPWPGCVAIECRGRMADAGRPGRKLFHGQACSVARYGRTPSWQRREPLHARDRVWRAAGLVAGLERVLLILRQRVTRPSCYFRALSAKRCAAGRGLHQPRAFCPLTKLSPPGVACRLRGKMRKAERRRSGLLLDAELRPGGATRSSAIAEVTTPTCVKVHTLRDAPARSWPALTPD